MNILIRIGSYIFHNILVIINLHTFLGYIGLFKFYGTVNNWIFSIIIGFTFPLAILSAVFMYLSLRFMIISIFGEYKDYNFWEWRLNKSILKGK
jgi:hypothetical protein